MKDKSFFDIVVILILVCLGLICLLPLLNTLAISLSDKTSAALGKVSVLPINFNLTSYQEILKDSQFFRSFGNSFIRTVLGTLINVVFSITMAFPLSRDEKDFKAKNIYMWILIFTMLFNGGIVPNFLLVKNLKLMDTIWALVLPGAVPVFSVLMLTNFFRGIPKSLEEAALVDGATPFYIMYKIFVPLAKPAIATICLFAVVYHWNAFFDGKLYISTPEKLPLQNYIQSLSININDLISKLSPDEMDRLDKISSVTFNSAKVIVSMIPIMVLYPFLQKYFVAGTTMGAVKE